MKPEGYYEALTFTLAYCCVVLYGCWWMACKACGWIRDHWNQRNQGGARK